MGIESFVTDDDKKQTHRINPAAAIERESRLFNETMFRGHRLIRQGSDHRLGFGFISEKVGHSFDGLRIRLLFHENGP